MRKLIGNTAAVLLGVGAATLIPATAKAATADLTVLDVQVRDADHGGTTTPTAGHVLLVGVDLENLGGKTVPRGTKLTCSTYQRHVGKKSSNTVSLKTIKAYQRKTITLKVPGVGTPGKYIMKCEADSGRRVTEADEHNNAKQVEFEEATRGDDDFRVTFENVRLEPHPSFPRSRAMATLRFEVKNPSSRGPAEKPLNPAFHALWQARCTAITKDGIPLDIDNPWHRPSDQTRFPQGELPGAGKTAGAGVWLKTYRLKNGDDRSFAQLRPQLHFWCAITTGVFTKVPLRGWKLVHKWSEQSFHFSVENPWSTSKPPEIRMTTLGVSASKDRHEPLAAQRNAWARFELRTNRGSGPITVQCTAKRDGTVVDEGTTVVTWPVSPLKWTSSVKLDATTGGAVNLGRLPAGAYDVSCRIPSLPSTAKDTDPGNNEASRTVTVRS